MTYEIKPDEYVDATLISRRVYGTSEEFFNGYGLCWT